METYELVRLCNNIIASNDDVLNYIFLGDVSQNLRVTLRKVCKVILPLLNVKYM